MTKAECIEKFEEYFDYEFNSLDEVIEQDVISFAMHLEKSHKAELGELKIQIENLEITVEILTKAIKKL